MNSICHSTATEAPWWVSNLIQRQEGDQLESPLKVLSGKIVLVSVGDVLEHYTRVGLDGKKVEFHSLLEIPIANWGSLSSLEKLLCEWVEGKDCNLIIDGIHLLGELIRITTMGDLIQMLLKVTDSVQRDFWVVFNSDVISGSELARFQHLSKVSILLGGLETGRASDVSGVVSLKREDITKSRYFVAKDGQVKLLL